MLMSGYNYEMVSLSRAGFLCVLVFVTFFFALTVHAQYDPPGIEGSVLIDMTPLHPHSGEKVHLTAQSNINDLSTALLTWTVNGKKFSSGIGLTQIDVTAGNLGESTQVTLDANIDPYKATAHIAITPTDVDILYESDSFIPPGYRGRALPSAGTNVRVQAVTRFVRPNGSLVPPESILYVWKRNDAVLADISGFGKSSALISAPQLFSTDVISLEARTSDNSFSGVASVSYPSIEPQLLLYEDHPLFGLMMHRALSTQTFIPESEMTFDVMPYFAQAAGVADPSLHYVWRVNGKDVAPDPVRPNALTVDAGKSAGTALVDLGLTRADNIFMNSTQSWSISFSSALRSGTSATGIEGPKNPFDQTTQ